MALENVRKAELLKEELDGLRPLNGEQEARIMQKFRLDWNYHSNHLEGNSLTFGETKALILHGITAQGKPLKDHFEITGHDEAIKWIDEVIKDERPLTENFIRELHTLLLKESSEKKAITPDGKATTRVIAVGKYKTSPNHVLTSTGETFYFATPEETPAKMHDLLEWYHRQKENKNVNPILLAAEFHYEFIRIHPFDDGNGRTARILMNFILMQFHYPPVIIKTEDKENYFIALRQADAGMIEPFIDYIANNLIRSLEIMIKGAKGGNIDEEDDIDKELLLLDQKINYISKKAQPLKNQDSIKQIYENSILPLAKQLSASGKRFERFYSNYISALQINDDTSVYDINSAFKSIIKSNTDQIYLIHNYKQFNCPGIEKFDFDIVITFEFAPKKFTVKTTSQKLVYSKYYNEFLSLNEIKEIADYYTKLHLSVLKIVVDSAETEE
ncbi:MAG: hypothetical protein JWO09_1217 [Bacteroidetes bacterium]|nr:hypothetical protein [Bacteroidota bacterium]